MERFIESVLFNLLQMQPEKGPREDVSKGDDWNEGKVIGPSLSVPFDQRYSDFFTIPWPQVSTLTGCHCLLGSRDALWCLTKPCSKPVRIVENEEMLSGSVKSKNKNK